MSEPAGEAATIYALSSGAPPAAISIIRVSGTGAGAALSLLAGGLPRPRRATARKLVDAAGEALDKALVLWFPGPQTATGEDLAELHVHGGRAVVAAVKSALAALPSLREAEPGEFTRRAFLNGRIDLAEAEGLADLLAAETELQRRAAITTAGGALSRRVEGWRRRVLGLSAEVEAALDFDEEDDGIGAVPATLAGKVAMLRNEIAEALAAPSAETLREGYRVALAGPPNAGKSTLFNALVGSEAAITAPTEGTTRDVLVRSVAMAGVPFTFVDMAGLRDESGDVVEAIGIARAEAEIARADLVLWLGPETEGPQGSWEIDARSDLNDRLAKHGPRFTVSALTGAGMAALRSALTAQARGAMPAPGEAALSTRQRRHLERAVRALSETSGERDILIIAEHLRQSRASFEALLGRTSTMEVLDEVFGRYCIGK